MAARRRNRNASAPAETRASAGRALAAANRARGAASASRAGIARSANRARVREASASGRRRRPSPPLPQPAATPAAPAAERPKRKRRRRRWGRRPKGIHVHDLLLPAGSGRQAIVYAESRAACTAMLREVAAELSGASDGPDPIALLVDPTPEELADWKREAPKAEIVSAGKAKHAEDAIAQARSRAGTGEDVIVLIDSLSRFAETFGGPDEARELFDAGLGAAGGSLTVVAALERSES